MIIAINNARCPITAGFLVTSKIEHRALYLGGLLGWKKLFWKIEAHRFEYRISGGMSRTFNTFLLHIQLVCVLWPAAQKNPKDGADKKSYFYSVHRLSQSLLELVPYLL